MDILERFKRSYKDLNASIAAEHGSTHAEIMKRLNEKMVGQLEQIYHNTMEREGPVQLAEGTHFGNSNSELK
jgi:hypothetical protein